MEEKLNLVIDQGNTRIKLGIFSGRNLISTEFFNNAQDFERSFTDRTLINKLYSSVLISDTSGKALPSLPEDLEPIVFSDLINFPVKIDYKTPETLGNDRIANVCGAMIYSPNALVIDAGTCITTDLLKAGAYCGGSIGPGLMMRYNSLNNYTGKLPLLKPHLHGLTGKSTEESIHSGAYYGAILELKHRIEEYKLELDDLTILLTGGDTGYFEKHLNCPIFADPNLTLKGLNEILLHIR